MINSIRIVIISKGLGAMLRSCLDAAMRAAEALEVCEIVVVDNSSEFPYRAEDFPQASPRIIRFDTHQSFSRSCNVAAANSSVEGLLFLNNDVFLSENTIAGMLRAFENDKVGICGAGLVFADDRIQHRGVVFGAGETGPYHLDRLAEKTSISSEYSEYQAVTGACMLVRRELFERLNGFDEDYPFGLEDIDFCLRARQRGQRVLCYNAHFSLHFESMTDGRIELDVPSRHLFMERWAGKYTIDG